MHISPVTTFCVSWWTTILMTARIDAYIEANALDVSLEISAGASPSDPASTLLELDFGAPGVTSIVWATGYRMDFAWILDAQLDEQGVPSHHGGFTAEPGPYLWVAVAH